ncbi:MAG: prealbumin-like fold domain-containing protein [Nitrosotalea sp.]
MFKQALAVILILALVPVNYAFAALIPPTNYPIAASDSITVGTSPALTSSHHISASDTISPTMNSSPTSFHQISVSDTMAPTMNSSPTSFHQISVSDTISPTIDSGSNSFHPILVSDTISPSIIETYGSNTFYPISAGDTLSIGSTAPAFSSNGSLTIQTKSLSLVPGATYAISPNPATNTGTLTVSDGGLGDIDGANDGIVKIAQVPAGTYNVTQTTTPGGYVSLLKSITVTSIPTQMDPSFTFQVTSDATNITQLEPTPITAPFVTSNTLNTWTTTFFASIVNSTSTNTVTAVNQLPSVIIAGKSNVTAVNASLDSQSSVLLDTSFPTLANGSTVINTFGVSNYTLTNSTSVVSIIPTIVTPTDPVSGQFVSTPPIARIIPGQEMIIPVQDSAIPSFGGLKEIDLQSSPTATPTHGTAASEWLVAQVDKKIPSSITSSGIQGTLALFMNIQYPYDQTGVGFNWGDPSTFAVPPTLTLMINKTSLSSVQQDSAGCPVINAYTLSSGLWSTTGLSEISSTSVSPTRCEIKIQLPHLSKFAFSISHLVSTNPGVGLSSNGAVAIGNTDLGGGASMAAAEESGLGNSQDNTQTSTQSSLKIYNVSYDVCYKKMIRIEVGSSGTDIPTVIVRTSLSNQIQATLSEDQILRAQNTDAKLHNYAFEASLDRSYDSFETLLLEKSGNHIGSVGQTIPVEGCIGNNNINDYTESLPIVGNTTVIKPFVETFPINNPVKIDLVKSSDGKVIAIPYTLHSSLKHDDNAMYRVIAPDGTCVIGSLENCIVSQSTQQLAGHVKLVTIAAQQFAVRYSGPDSPLERFSITSPTPIVGQWKVEVDSRQNSVPQLNDMQQTSLIVRYGTSGSNIFNAGFHF